MRNLYILLIVFIVFQKCTFARQGWFLQNPYPTTTDLYSVDYINELIVIVEGTKGIILRTADGGEAWISQSIPEVNELCAVFIINSNIGWAVGRAATILKTSNGGVSFIEENEFNEIVWYAENLKSRVYFYQFKAGSFVETKKMVLMK